MEYSFYVALNSEAILLCYYYSNFIVYQRYPLVKVLLISSIFEMPTLFGGIF